MALANERAWISLWVWQETAMMMLCFANYQIIDFG
jgi:hypothetical protein